MEDGYQQTLSGLLRKRADIAGEAQALRDALDAKLAALDALDTVIRVFNPQIGPEDLPERRPLPVFRGATSDIRRFLLELLKQGPVRTMDATDALLKARDIDQRDRVMVTLIRKRVTDAFGRMRKLGMIEGRRFGSGTEREWRLVG